MTNMIHRLAIVAALLLLAGQAEAAPVVVSGKVIHIADGDTLTILDAQNFKHLIRLEGIDAPAHKQAFGAKARLALVAMALDKPATATVIGQDRNGHELGRLSVGNDDINLRMVREGCAWWSRKQAPNDKALAEAEKQARDGKRGLWIEANPVPPWEWHKPKKSK